jgi:hypothetical protein
MPIIPAKPPYIRRNTIPKAYDAGWLGTELQNVQRGMPSQSIRTVTADYTPTANDFTIAVDCTAGPVTIRLRPANQVQGLYLHFKKVDSSANGVTIQGTVDGTTNPTLTGQYDHLTIQSDGTQYLEL